jgi:hypothetical protein
MPLSKKKTVNMAIYGKYMGENLRWQYGTKKNAWHWPGMNNIFLHDSNWFINK